MTRNLGAFALGVCLAGFAAGSVVAQAPAESGWIAACAVPGETFCELRKEITQGEVVAASISILHARGDLWLQYLIPVGIGIGRGVEVGIDENEAYETSVSNCTARGCVGHTELSHELLAEMKKGGSFHVRFSSAAHHETFTISFSLADFSRSFDAFYAWPGQAQ